VSLSIPYADIRLRSKNMESAARWQIFLGGLAYRRMSDFVSSLKIPTALIVTAGFLSLLVLESWFPLRQGKRSRGQRLIINLCMSGLAFVAGALIVMPLALELSAWTSEKAFGLLRLVVLPFAAEFIFGFLLMDLSFYYWHRANHVFPLLWRFHNVHHVDPDLDVSTSFRFHFGEVLYSLGFRGLQVYLIGVSPVTYVVYELVFQCATMFHHSNVRLPITVERWLNKIIVTPRMHGIHHSVLKEETNSNFSVIFRWWDLIHRTLRLNVKQSEVIIGVPGYVRPEDNRFWNLLVLPFRKQKNYWPLSGGRAPKKGVAGSATYILLP
jgi:sterol desaturase/sphingolipid hydroxylase (fatty acid hydroxylase superfamily)